MAGWAASAAVSGVVGMIGSGGGGLSICTRVGYETSKLQWSVSHLSISSLFFDVSIDQLDKADAPPIPSRTFIF